MVLEWVPGWEALLYVVLPPGPVSIQHTLHRFRNVRAMFNVPSPILQAQATVHLLALLVSTCSLAIAAAACGGHMDVSCYVLYPHSAACRNRLKLLHWTPAQPVARNRSAVCAPEICRFSQSSGIQCRGWLACRSRCSRR
jgi:hypothetical protein